MARAYIFNMGYPLLTENTRLLIPSRQTTPRDKDAAANPEAWKTVHAPVDGLPEMCYYHNMKAASDGMTLVAVFNPGLDVGVVIRFSKKVLDHFVQWHQLTRGYYTIGLEPCNATIDGVADAVANGSAKWLEPDEEITYELTVELLPGASDFKRLERECAIL